MSVAYVCNPQAASKLDTPTALWCLGTMFLVFLELSGGWGLRTHRDSNPAFLASVAVGQLPVDVSSRTRSSPMDMQGRPPISKVGFPAIAHRSKAASYSPSGSSAGQSVHGGGRSNDAGDVDQLHSRRDSIAWRAWRRTDQTASLRTIRIDSIPFRR